MWFVLQVLVRTAAVRMDPRRPDSDSRKPISVRECIAPASIKYAFSLIRASDHDTSVTASRYDSIGDHRKYIACPKLPKLPKPPRIKRKTTSTMTKCSPRAIPRGP